MSIAEQTLAAVLWDMDGTLVDSEPRWMESQTRLVAEFGGVFTREDGLSLVGTETVVTAEALQRAGVRLSAEEIILRLTEEVTRSLERDVTWRPGAYELVGAIMQAGIPQAIVTTSPRFMTQVVADSLPTGAITVIVAGEDVRNGKPHPEPYLSAVNALGVTAGNCVAIEDSPTGLAAAIAAGVVAIGVPHEAALNNSGRWARFDSLSGVTVADLVRLVGSSFSS